MRDVWVLFLLFILITAAGCSGKGETPERDYPVINNPEWGIYQDYENPPVRFELIDSIAAKLPDNELIAGINFLQTDLTSNIYFLDRQQSKLISLSADGNFRWATGQQGKGPGDFENTYSMVNNGEQLYVGNIQGTRVDLFNFNGSYLKSYNTGEKIQLGFLNGFNTKGELLITTPIWGKLGTNLYFSTLAEDSIHINNEIEIVEPGFELAQGMSAGPRLSLYDSLIFASSRLNYSIKIYNREAELVKDIQRDFDKIAHPGMHSSNGSSALFTFGGLTEPKFLPDGSFIITSSWPTNLNDPNEYVRRNMEGNARELVYRHSVDIFNKEGNLLYSFEGNGTTPSIGRIEHIDHQGIIYTVSTDSEPVIYRYKLITPEQL